MSQWDQILTKRPSDQSRIFNTDRDRLITTKTTPLESPTRRGWITKDRSTRDTTFRNFLPETPATIHLLSYAATEILATVLLSFQRRPGIPELFQSIPDSLLSFLFPLHRTESIDAQDQVLCCSELKNLNRDCNNNNNIKVTIHQQDLQQNELDYHQGETIVMFVIVPEF